MNRRLALGIIILTLLCGAACAQQEVTVGKWTATIGPSGLDGLAFDGDSIVRSGRIAGYLPEWAGGRFTMTDGEVTVTDDGAVWHRDDPGNQEATVTLRMTPDKVTFALQTTVTAAGPSEWSVMVNPEAVRSSEEHCMVWLNGKLKTLMLNSPLDNIGGITEMRFEQAERTVILRCTGLGMQDRRATGMGLYFVRVLGSSGAAPVTYERTIEFEVIEANPAEVEARRDFIDQRAAQETEVQLRNPDFEAETLEGWSAAPIASIDTETVHAGAQSAKMSLQSAAEYEGNAYLIQTVPAQPGRLYRAEAMIKAEDVRAAAVGGMSAAGATIIVEFADTEGKWLAAGSYGPKLFGSFDWRRVTTEPARAPEGAGSAIIYLALRAEGTAWFDDVRCFEVEYPIIMIEPMADATIHDNTPRLDYYYEALTETTIELCRNDQFPEAETVRIEHVLEPPVQLAEPIEPGTWYWRVRCGADGTISDTWKFEQTARLDEDTTSPTIAACHAWLEAPRAPMVIQYTDNVGVTDVALTVDGEDVSDRLTLGDDAARYLPGAPWSEGLHKVHAVAEDAAGNSTQRDLFFTHTKPLPKTEWLRSGGVAVDGERHFLLGMYGIDEKHMPEMAAAGINYVHRYTWDGAGTAEGALAYMDAAQANGMQAFMGLQRSKLIEGDEEFIAERVAALMAHPGLLCWYLFDEPDLKHQYVPPALLEREYRLIRALDPFHPVVVTCAGDAPVPLYAGAMDVHWTQVYGDTNRVATRLDKHRDMLPEGMPISAILHCYDRAQSSLPAEQRDPAKFQPDGRMMRANAFMALAHDASCLSWWWWGHGGGTRFMTVPNAPEEWAALQQTMADVRSLEPVLTADGEVHRSVIEAEGAQVHVWEKRLDDRTVIIAVNRDDIDCDVKLTPVTLANDAALTVLFEQRAAALADGELSEHFGPREVHVYESRR